MIYILKKLVPRQIKLAYKEAEYRKLRKDIAKLPLLSKSDFKDILSNQLLLKSGDDVFIHSSLDKLNLDFPVFEALSTIIDIIGKDGTILFPTYPKINSALYLKSKEVFNIKRTPSYTGILSEIARRHQQAKRSLHPTKSVVAIGKNSVFYTETHNESPYPYDYCSPYYKLAGKNAKIIGLGVKTTYLSFVHTVDDFLKDKFPVNPYHKELFESVCINYENRKIPVQTYAHNMSKMNFDLPKFFKEYIPSSICSDIEIEDMSFFKADARNLFENMIELVTKKNITIYPRYYYKINKLFIN